MNKNKPLEQSFNDTVTLRRECSTYVKNQKKSKISRVDTQLPCGAKFLRVLIFAIFEVFFTIRKKKKLTAKIFSAKIYSTVEITYKTSPFTRNLKLCWCPSIQNVSLIQEKNKLRNKAFRNKKKKHYEYATAKGLTVISLH